MNNEAKILFLQKVNISLDEDITFLKVLLSKIDASPAKQFVELYAGVVGQERKCYL